MPAVSQLLPDKLSSALMLLANLLGAHFHNPGRSNPGCDSLGGCRLIFPSIYIHMWGPVRGRFGTSLPLVQKTDATHESLLWI